MAWLGFDFKVQYLDTLDQALFLSGCIVCQRERNIWMLRESNEYEKASQDDPQQMKIPENQQMSLGV